MEVFMAEVPRLNGVIRAFEQGKHAFATFSNADVDSALALSVSNYDGIIFELEHNPWDVKALRDCLQYMLNRRQIAECGSYAPAVTPFVRIPPNGSEKNQWLAKQALDLGVYGIVWPHISTVDQAYNAVTSCRYPRPKTDPLSEPAGARGDAPTAAVRYWGLTQQEYYTKADVWPLNPKGEILVVLMIEDLQGIANLSEMLKTVPGIGLILIGEGDLSQELGCPRQYDHPSVIEAMSQIIATCKEHNVPVGHPHVGSGNVERILMEGYRFLIAAPTRSYAALERGRQLVDRR
jgi:4-hydroxy-2-oxoheptanedioate aldolase